MPATPLISKWRTALLPAVKTKSSEPESRTRQLPEASFLSLGHGDPLQIRSPFRRRLPLRPSPRPPQRPRFPQQDWIPFHDQSLPLLRLPQSAMPPRALPASLSSPKKPFPDGNRSPVRRRRRIPAAPNSPLGRWREKGGGRWNPWFSRGRFRTKIKMRDGSTTYTVDEALTSQGFGYFQVLVLAYAGMGWISEATEMMLLSFIGPSVQVQWNLSSHEESLITSVVFVGMLIGAYSWGVVSDNYGRRIGFLFTAIVTSGAGILSSLAPNYISLIFLRFVVGIGLGGGPVLASWFLEFVPAPNRGTWMVVFQGFWTIGTILEASLAWAVMPTLGWRWLLAFSSLPSFLLLLFYGMAPESPRYLCMKGRTSEAMLILEKMARANGVTLPHGVLVSDKKVQMGENPHPSESIHLIAAQDQNSVISEDIESKTGGITALAKLLSPELIRSTLLLWMVFFGNAFSYYGIVLLTSELSGGSRCASDHVIMNSVPINLYKDVFISSFAEVPGLLLSAIIVDRLGRKLSMSAMLFISCVFLLPLVVNQNEALTTALLFCARVCISGSFNIVYVYAPEIYPTSLRTTGVGTGSSVGRIGGMLCPLVAVALVHGCHQTIAVLLFVLVLFLSGVAVIFFPLETSGRGLADSVSSMK